MLKKTALFLEDGFPYSVKMFTFADDLSRLQKSIIFVQKKKPKHGVQNDMTSTDTETL